MKKIENNINYIQELDYENYLLTQKCQIDDKADFYTNKIDEFYFLIGYLAIVIIVVYLFENLFENFSIVLIQYFRINLNTFLFTLTNHYLNIIKIILVIFTFNRFNLFSACFLVYIDSLGIIIDYTIKIIYSVRLDYINYTSFIMVLYCLFKQDFQMRLTTTERNSKKILSSIILISITLLVILYDINSYPEENRKDLYKFLVLSLNMAFMTLYLYLVIFEYTFEGFESTKIFFNFTNTKKNIEIILFFLLVYFILYMIINKQTNDLLLRNSNQNLSRIFFLFGVLISNTTEFHTMFFKNYYLYSNYNLRTYHNPYIYNNTSIFFSILRFILMTCTSILFEYIITNYFIDQIFQQILLQMIHSFTVFFVSKRIFSLLNILNNFINNKLSEFSLGSKVSLDNNYLMLQNETSSHF
jgi:hypothetical protein